MKKRYLTAAALAAILVCTGCNNGGTAQTTTTAAATTTTTAAASTTAAEATTTTAAETTTAKETSAPEKTDETEETFDGYDGDVVFYDDPIFTDLAGNNYYRSEAEVTDYGELVFPFAYMRPSTGLCYTSYSNPEMFVPEDFTYTGETAPFLELVRYEAGDKVGSLTVKSAKTYFYPPYNSDTGEFEIDATEGFHFSRVEVDFEGEITLSGAAFYYYDEMYARSSGDIEFLPINYETLPLPVDISNYQYRYGTLGFPANGGVSDDGGYLDEVYAGGECFYSDAPMLHLGNLFKDYPDYMMSTDFQTDIFYPFRNVDKNVSVGAEFTLSDLHLEWNDNFGAAYSCYAKITNVGAWG
ncbi:MAG: hypothetical protein IK093_12575 [Ruminiclostridium sp.]|nr:hypothetical protein [Ruminiclostridium sp.]